MSKPETTKTDKIDIALLDAALNALETVFPGYGIILAVFDDGDGSVVTNRAKAVVDEVFTGFLGNAKLDTPSVAH